jgi:o-succinylbenzoate---CoA ligase
VAACGVFGLADDQLGQRVAAAVVLTPCASAPTLQELRDHVAQTLDRTAAPREVHVLDELPLLGIGKIDRRALAARFQIN